MSKRAGEPYDIRSKALAQFADSPPMQVPVRSAGKLLHELHVYQIEMEMQNDELRRAQIALEESRDRYVDLYEFAPVGYLTLNRHGVIAKANLTGAALLGVERKKLLNRRFAGFVIQEDSERWHSHFLDTLQRDGHHNCELALQSGDGSRIHAQIDCLCMDADSESSVRITLTDITKRMRAEDSLRKSREQLLAFIQHAPISIAMFNMDMDYLSASGRWIAEYGRGCSCLAGRNHYELHPDIPADWKGFHQQALAGATLKNNEDMWIQADGSEHWLRWALQPWLDENGIIGGIIISAEDISERKRAEQQLRELSAHLQTVREEEKASFAREIHDELGSTLLALRMETFCLVQKLAADEKMVHLLKHTDSMDSLLGNAVKATRRIITDLRPPLLDDHGLLAALEVYADQFQKRNGIETRFVCVQRKDKGCDDCRDCESTLNKTQSINLFRIFQETLTNVARHSGASRVEAKFGFGSNEVTLSISDNGCGLPEGHAIASTSFGLLGMRERIEQLNGKIRFDNQPGSGFGVTVILPLPAARH